jgi:signal transduction histidine kinase
MRTFLGLPVKARGTVFGNIYLTEKRAGADFDQEDQWALEVLAAQAGVAVENATLYEQARQRERRLEAVRESATAILSGAPPGEVLELMARQARQLAGADLATIAVPASRAGWLVIQVADGENADAVRGLEFRVDSSLSGEAIRTGTPALLEDASAESRAYQPMIQSGEIGPAMFVPLSIRGSAFGTLAIANRPLGRRFSREDLSLVETFAGQASVAIEYGRAQRELQRLIVMDERERIAKELHDGVIQSLFAAGMGLQATASLSQDSEIEDRIGTAVNELDQVIRDLRNYIFGLRPGILADRQLDQALHHLVREFEGRTGVVAVAEVDPDVAARLSSRAGDVVQLAREALSNVGRHASAATCRLTLRAVDTRAILEIDDDGRGFDPSTTSSAGQGLRNIRERAGALGSEIQIETGPDRGTTVRVLLPL